MPAPCLESLAARGLRPLLTLAVLGVVAVASASAGCGSDGSSASSATSQSNTSGGDQCGLTAAENDEFCAKEADKIDCTNLTNQAFAVCGIGLPDPGTPAARSTSVKEFHGSGPVDLACYEKSHYPSASTSSKVKVSGVAKIFSSGCNSHDLKIEFYTVQRGGASDGDLGSLVGSSTITDPETTCVTTGNAVANDKCGAPRYECPYEYDGVPTETELVIKTSSPAGRKDWAPLYDYNIYIHDKEVSGGKWDHDVRALAADDYSVIPRAAIGSPVTPGHGVIAGEVHDCGDVRLSGAVVSIDLPSAGLFYFNDDEDAPLPKLSATVTSTLGLYTALDIKPGPIDIAAIADAENKTLTAGHFRARIFPDAVTAVTFRGLEPFQVP